MFATYVAAGLLMSTFVPANRFSLHGMYRQRLVRTFLGASRRDRRPNAFTGFDAHDDLLVHELADVRPLHVINTTLNAVSTHAGRTPRTAGASRSRSRRCTPAIVRSGYRRGLRVRIRRRGARHGPVARHGAGRLGRGRKFRDGHVLDQIAGVPADARQRAARALVRQPAERDDVARSEPPLGVGPVVREMLGLTTDSESLRLPVGRRPLRESRPVGDGGPPLPVHRHLGCRAAIRTTRYDDLANAMRRIRLDLGVPIQFPRIARNARRAGQRQPARRDRRDPVQRRRRPRRARRDDSLPEGDAVRRRAGRCAGTSRR